jgi:hypothetical protein
MMRHAVLGLTLVAVCTWGHARTWGAAEPTKATGVVFNDANTNGVRDDGEAGVPKVRVSNGREIVATDADGKYTLPVDDDTILYVLKPRGWMTAVDKHNVPRFYYHHCPNGAPEGRYPGVAPTGPLPKSVDFPLRKQDEPDKFDVVMMGDPQVNSLGDIDYLSHDILEALVGTKAAFGLTLGDLANEKLELHEPLTHAYGRVGVPWYYVPGNHDMDVKAPDEDRAPDAYERVFGPRYYAFDYGPVHFITLEDIEWHGGEDGKSGTYRAGLGEEQLAFVLSDLRALPAEQLVVLTMHIPIQEIAEKEELFKALAEHPHAVSYSGHTHYYRHWFLGDKQGWPGQEPHHHTTIGTSCGSWWTGMPDEVGIPNATMSDGAPNCWVLVTFDGQKVERVQYRAARRPADYQMNIYTPDPVTDKTAEIEVLVNVFAGSARSTVEMRLGDGAWTKLEKVDREDPSFVALKESEKKLPPPRKMPKPTKCGHLWRGTLPSGLEPGSYVLEVRTTDVFGQTYTARRIMRVE